ncbi:hypothetical protein TrST_g2833 [Triparma strigata]|uniref:Uncharacterized protein n=1 Tax=Triparma strigata TaxID=1606541 RepID=A0A9W7EIL9_9STRA|nr:hypothetical protein TrST_g2833 [Triparma strigata]
MDSWFSELRSGTAPTSTRTSSTRTSSLATPIRKAKKKDSGNFADRAKKAMEGAPKEKTKKKKKKKRIEEETGSARREKPKARPGTSGELSDLNRVLRQQIQSQKDTIQSHLSHSHSNLSDATPPQSHTNPNSNHTSPSLIWDISNSSNSNKRSPINIMDGPYQDGSPRATPDRIASPIYTHQVDDADDAMGFAGDEGRASNPKKTSPLVRSASSAAILGVRSGGSGMDSREAIMATLLNNMSLDDDNISRRSSWGNVHEAHLEVPDMPRQTITDRPQSASGKSRVSSARLQRPQPYKVERTRNKSASLTRRKENAVRRAAAAGAGENGRELWMQGGGGDEQEVVRPPSRQSNAFPMSLAGNVGTSNGGGSKVNKQGGEADAKGGSNNQTDDQTEQDKSKLFPSKRPRPSSRKKPPAKSMFLNDAKLDSKREVVTPHARHTTGWGDTPPTSQESSPVVQPTKSTDKNNIILRTGSPSNLSLGNPDEDIEFIMSPVPPTRVREIDERRDNPEKDGFSEIEESGLYEIKIEVNNSRDQEANRTQQLSAKISERISPLLGDEEDEVLKNLTSSSDSDDKEPSQKAMEMGGLRHSRMIRTAPSTAAFLGASSLGNVQPTPPEVRPDTVAATNGIGGDDMHDSEDDYSDGCLSPAFTPVANSAKGWTEGTLEDDDLLLQSYNGDDGLDEFDLDTNLGTDFLSLFAPSPPPQQMARNNQNMFT